MATFKACVRTKKEDGTYVVYIRATQNRKNIYLNTGMLIFESKVKDGEITDQMVLAQCGVKIKEYLDKINSRDTENWTVKQVVDYISGGDKIPFYPFCEEYVTHLRKAGRDKTAEGYDDALKSFKKHFTNSGLTFQDIKQKDLKSWIETLNGTARAKQKYPSNMKAIFEAGRDKFNDYEDNMIFVANNPFYKLDIPKCDEPQKKAVDIESLRKLFSIEPIGQREEIAQDIAKLMIYLVGMNTIDMFDMEDWRYANGKLSYERHKTRTVRVNKARTQVAVRPEILDLFVKYKGEPGYLFSFRNRYRDPKGFYENINKGLKTICEREGLEKMTTNTLRHTWATIAKNDCKASDELIDFCLVHAPANKMAWKYIKVDYSPIDDLNNQVLAKIFNPENENENRKESEKN